MKKIKAPLSVIIISWLFIAAGTVGFIYHATELKDQDLFANDSVWVLIVRILAIIGGVFTLRGAIWARWLLLFWIAYHVFLSAFHELPELIVHSVLLIIVAYILFRPKASLFFKGSKAEPGNTK